MKHIIITGAGGNLGKAVTNTFLEKGYYVIATVSSEQSKADIPTHTNIETHVVDLADEIATGKFVQGAIDRHKKIDGAVLLAGGFAGGTVAKTSTGDIRSQIELNFDTAYNVARPVFSHMLDSGSGRIIFIGSRPAIEPAAGKTAVAYALSKSLLFRLSDFMNAEAKGRNVVSTVVAPSTLDTEPNRKSMPDVDPAKWVKPSALAEILEFVMSDKGEALRETVLKVYGGA